MPLADEHIGQVERTVPLLDDTPGFPMTPYVTKKPLTPRDTPDASPRSTPVSFGGSQDSRESFGGRFAVFVYL